MKHLVSNEQTIRGLSRTNWQDCFIAGSNPVIGLEPSARQHA